MAKKRKKNKVRKSFSGTMSQFVGSTMPMGQPERIDQTSKPPSVLDRFLRGAESSFVQTPVSIVGGLLGVFAYGPLLVVMSISVFAGIHRNKSLEGLSSRRQLAVWCVIIPLVFVSLWWVGLQIEKHRDHIPTPSDIGKQVLQDIGPLLKNPVTNNIYKIVSREPKLAQMQFGFADENGNTVTALSIPSQGLTFGPMRQIDPKLPPMSIPSELVNLRFMGRVSSSVPAKNAHVFVRICDSCDYTSVPEGFHRPLQWPQSKTDVDKVFGDLPAGPQFLVGDFQISMPLYGKTTLFGDTASISVVYTCDNCLPAGEKTATHLTVRTIRSGK